MVAAGRGAVVDVDWLSVLVELGWWAAVAEGVVGLWSVNTGAGGTTLMDRSAITSSSMSRRSRAVGLVEASSLGLERLNSPFSVCWDFPEQPPYWGGEEAIVWVARCDGEEAEEGGAHAEGYQTQHQPCWSDGKSKGHNGHDDQSHQSSRWYAPFVEARICVSNLFWKV